MSRYHKGQHKLFKAMGSKIFHNDAGFSCPLRDRAFQRIVSLQIQCRFTVYLPSWCFAAICSLYDHRKESTCADVIKVSSNRFNKLEVVMVMAKELV
jgi:hypothetical protein